jgi:hypothetical protein
LSEYYVAWWNLENLYDAVPWDERARKVRNVEKLDTKLKDWDEAALDLKLSQLAGVINEMNGGKGPDILGVCEVENRDVMKKLVSKIRAGAGTPRSYDVVHHDCRDERGIDVAFVYDRDLFDFYVKDPNAKRGSDDGKYWFSYEVVKRSPTRDIFQVNFMPKGDRGRPFVVLGNHWPSRMDGVYESEPYRILAAETLSYFVKRIQEVLGDDIPILVMGDFNDEPGSRSLTDYALSSRNRDHVLRADNPRLLNLCWPSMGGGYGTFWYDGPLFFDQFLVSRGFLVDGGYLYVNDGSYEVIRPRKLWEDPRDRKYPKPRGFDWKPRDPPGYSDHFPVAVKIKTRGP